MPRLFALAALLFAIPAHAEVALDWVTVGNSKNVCDTRGLPITSADLATGTSGSTALNQSFNGETRGVSATVLGSEDWEVTSMTLRTLDTVSNPTIVGARIYSSGGTLLASRDTFVDSGSQQTIKISIAAILTVGESYRISFYSSSGVADLFDPDSTPYTEDKGVFQVNGAFSVSGDGFPNDVDSFVPLIEVEVTPAKDCFGSVYEGYEISKYEVTNAQYSEFLNAVAATDTRRALQHADIEQLRYRSRFRAASRAAAARGASRLQRHRRASRTSRCELRDRSIDATALRELAAQRPADGRRRTTRRPRMGPTRSRRPGCPSNHDHAQLGAEVFLPSEDEWYKAAYYGRFVSSIRPTSTIRRSSDTLGPGRCYDLHRDGL